MAFTQGAFIYLGAGEEHPDRDRAVLKTKGLTTTIVAVPSPEAAVTVAKELVADGAQSLELCGGFGTKTVAEVVEAVGSRVPVAGVTYGVESVHALAALFPEED